MSAFDEYRKTAWPIEFRARIHVVELCGGTPADEKVAESWLRSKVATDSDDLIRAMVAETMAERGVDAEEAAKQVASDRHVQGFKRDGEGLYIEGRQVKAALKEAASVAMASDKLKMKGWGKTNKGIIGYLAEHVVVLEERIHLGREDADGVRQGFIHKTLPKVGRISAIQYEEYARDVDLSFTVRTDHDFTEEEWAMIWLTGEQQGIGASRSQGYGRYTVTEWEGGRLT